jgi:peptidoglycan/xylan/chitin deacetylase (PgdA/CDA1 family)
VRWFSLIVVGISVCATSWSSAEPTVKDAKPAAIKDAKDKPKDAPKDETLKAPEPALTALTNDPVLGKSSRVEGEETHGVVAFTFDDGPNPETTPAVIDALEKYDIPATFFIVTQRLGKHNTKSRDVLARELADGFLVGSHSVTHPNLKHASGDTITKEIDQSFRTLAKEANRPIGMFRPPYGALSGAGRQRLKQLGVTEVIWSVDTLDWKAHDAAKLRKKVMTMIVKQNGGVVLMHDVKPITAKIIADVLDDLEAENCARLADKKDPIYPVSLHYFLRDGKTPRAVPAEVQKKTDAYKTALPGRCSKRPAVVKTAEAPKAEKPDHPKDTHVKFDNDCVANPLAKGCN